MINNNTLRENYKKKKNTPIQTHKKRERKHGGDTQ